MPQTDVKTGELYVADADVKTNVAYALPVDLAKSPQKDEIEVWLVALPSTALYLPYRISVPTAFGSGSVDAFVPSKSVPTMIPSQALTKGKKSPHLSPSMSATGTKQTCSMR
jgi:hypothetical protein